ncbi:MAG TPA: hypothetical protein VL147_04230, partial [Devosia sp.]|nr:hypothetical protein [Devosia sp.]
MRDLASFIAAAMLIGPATLAADNTPASFDLQGFDSAAILLAIGAGGITFDGSNKIEFVLTHADDDGTGSPGAFTPVTAADIYGANAPTTVTGGIVKSLIVAHAAADVTEIGYKGGKRFLKLLADFSGTHGTGT